MNQAHVAPEIRSWLGDSVGHWQGDTLVVDPTVWTQPWSGEYVWPATDTRVYEYACHEANYSLGGILRGARLLEAEAGGAR